MPRQSILKENDAPDSNNEKAIVSDTLSPNDMHPNFSVRTELSNYDKECASLERTFTDVIFAKHESSGQNQIALTNKQYEAIKEYLETTKAHDLCKDSHEKHQLNLKLREIRRGPMYQKHWRKAYFLNDG